MKLFRYIFIFAALAASSVEAQTLQVYADYVPVGVSLGISIEQFRVARPDAVLVTGSSIELGETDQNFDFGEEVGISAPFLHIGYKFKGRSLRAFWWSYGGVGADTVANNMRTQMLAGFTKESDDTLKVILDGQKVTVPLELWRTSDGTRKAYLVAPSNAVQLLVFDPATVTKIDLFDDVDAIE